MQDVGNMIYDTLLLPGDFVLYNLVAHAPVLASSLGIDGDGNSVMLRAVLSLLLWFLSAVVVWKIFRFAQNVARYLTAVIRTISFRISLATRNLRMGLMCRLRRLVPRRSNGADAVAELELDDLDLAVLQSTAACGPAFTTSALELADQFPLRPAQIQHSLDKLCSNKMLDHATGSTDGFETYRLSQSGAYFLAMWQSR